MQERGWEAIDEDDAYDVAVALGVFDYVDEPVELLERMGRPRRTWWRRSPPRGCACSCAECATAPAVCTCTATGADDLARLATTARSRPSKSSGLWVAPGTWSTSPGAAA